MIEVYKNIYVGNQDDYELKVKHEEGWYIIHACKEPYHRQALGYTGRAASKTDPEYLLARRGENRLILNLVDVDNMDWVSPTIIDAALEFINEFKEQKVLIHCNQGMSRSAVIGMLYLSAVGAFISADFSRAEEEYKRIYAPYCPAKGMRDYAKNNWTKYYLSLKHD